jgi:hypothetical protein
VTVTQLPTPTQTPKPLQPPAPGPPAIAIRANGQFGSISVTANVTPVSITVSLAPGGLNGKIADWWLAYSSPAGWYSLTANGWIPGINLLFKYQLFSIYPTVIFSSTLSFGDYAFYFLVDMSPDGVIDSPFHCYYDLVKVQIPARSSLPPAPEQETQATST